MLLTYLVSIGSGNPDYTLKALSQDTHPSIV